MTIAARVVLEGAERTRAAGGTTGGFLCERHGLLPCEPPLTALPRSHAAWDEAAAAMPEMFRSLRGRETLDAMPELPADAAALPERYLHRACALLGMLAHTYVRVRPDPPERLPPTIAVPWAVLCRRLGRDATTLTYDDLIAYNWRLRDPSAPEPRTLEHLDLLFPTVGNREEQVFYLAQVEMHAEGAPLIGAMVRAQEAVAADDPAGLELEIAAMQDVIERLTYGSFLKVDANPHSATYVDPVVWAKTVAPFAVSISQGAHAISGAAAPIFQLLDAFVGRSRFDSRIGRETRSLQSGYPREMREFLHALAGTSVGAYVGRCGSRRLSGLWQGLLDAYVGNHGFLGVHRRKAYAFLEVAFKVGRSVTTGGFTGLFEEQTWEVANQELELARRERDGSVGGGCPMGAVSASRGELTSPGLVHLRLDMAGSGLRFRPGDRLAVQPRNDPQLVARTLRSLQAAGDEPVPLDGTWRSALAELYSDAPPHRIPLRELLDAGRIRPVSRATAKALQRRSESERLGHIVNERTESAWELWDLLELLAEGGFDTRQLWRADPWEPYAIAKLVPPEDFRLYSIASAMPADGPVTADEVELLVSELRYETSTGDPSQPAHRAGTASAFLARLAAEDGGTGPLPAVRVVRAPRFRLPEDPTRPIVMLAGGAGISAYRGFVAARLEQRASGPALLILTTQGEERLRLFRQDLDPAIRAGTLVFDAEVTAGSGRRVAGGGISVLVERHAESLLEALYAGDDGPVFYVCGPAAFAAAAIAALEVLAERGGAAGEGRGLVRRMVARGRLQQDVFTSPLASGRDEPRFDASEVAFHSDETKGAWTIIDGGVYDLTEFAHLHPGGRAILLEVAGRDGTLDYRRIEHHLEPEIEAMLPMYRIGAIRRIDFGVRGALVVGPDGLHYAQLGDLFRAWVRFLHLVVEVDNAVRHDFSVLDAVTVQGDDPDEPTLLKAQLLLDTHRRFFAVYLPPLLGGDLTELWQISAGFCAPETDVRALERELEKVTAEPSAATAESGSADASTALDGLGALPEAQRLEALARITTLRGALEEADLGFLAGLKSAVAHGVRCAERWDRETPERAAVDLMSTLAGVPGLVSDLQQHIADAFEGHARGAGPGQSGFRPPPL